MEPLASGGGAAALAIVLLVCAAAPAAAHDELEKTAQEAAAAPLYRLERTEASGAADTASRSRFGLVLFMSAGLVGATGFLGGALVDGLDHYAWQV